MWRARTNTPTVDRPFSLTRGGPTYRLWLVLARGNWLRLSLLVTAVTWSPIVVLSIVEWRATGKLPSLFVSYSLHIKLLIAIPVLLAAEDVLHMRTGRCIERIMDERWAEPTSKVAALVVAPNGGATHASRRSSRWCWRSVEARWSPGGCCSRWASSAAAVLAAGSASAVWHAVVALGIYQYLLVRWIWRWWIWTRLLWGLSRLKLRAIATHPDKQGGLGFLAQPTVGFAAVIFAVCTVQASVWADQWRSPTSPSCRTSKRSRHCWRLRCWSPWARWSCSSGRCGARGSTQSASTAGWRPTARMFHARWIMRGEREELLGSPDVSSLADMATSYEVIKDMRPLPFNLYNLIFIALAVLAPMIPLALMQVPLLKLLGKLSGVAAGGIPH